MNDRPLLFSGPMVRALLAGTKSQTRRIVKSPALKCPYGLPGDQLWVKETYRFGPGYDDSTPTQVMKCPHAIIRYESDGALRLQSGETPTVTGREAAMQQHRDLVNQEDAA